MNYRPILDIFSLERLLANLPKEDQKTSLYFYTFLRPKTDLAGPSPQISLLHDKIINNEMQKKSWIQKILKLRECTLYNLLSNSYLLCFVQNILKLQEFCNLKKFSFSYHKIPPFSKYFRYKRNWTAGIFKYFIKCLSSVLCKEHFKTAGILKSFKSLLLCCHKISSLRALRNFRNNPRIKYFRALYRRNWTAGILNLTIFYNVFILLS